jgi:hypothetical protein
MDGTLETSSLGGLSVGERDGALMSMRRRTFGPSVSAASRCPHCDERVELSFEIDELQAVVDACGAPPASFTVEEDGWSVTGRLPCCDDVISVEAASSEDEAEAELWRRCTLDTRFDGEPRTADEVPESVKALMDEQLARADPQADVQLRLECPTCATSWDQDFDIASFLWTEVDTWARGLLAEVHVLARAYGWTESDVLALSPFRRRTYLELARG